MKSDNKLIFYKGKLPFYAIPLAILIGIVVLSLLVFFGLIIGIAVGVVILVLGALRFISTLSGDNKRNKRVESQPENIETTIILEEQDYEILKKEDKE